MPEDIRIISVDWNDMPEQILIKKYSGVLVPFDAEKIKNTCRRAGASEELAEKVAKMVESKVYRGMTTREIMKLTLKILDKEKPAVAARYTLRDAIFKLGPAGFHFEKYVAALLKAYGYKTKLPPILQGACVEHEIDVAAEKDNRAAIIECKLRQSVRIFISIKDVMSTWARFLDLVDGAAIGKCPHYDEIWIVTNARISGQGTRYGHCKNMVLLSWDHPRDRPLPAWIDDKTLYPITVLRKLDKASLDSFAKAGVLLVRDLTRRDTKKLQEKIKIPKNKLEKFIKEAKEICAL
ncbi:MAG: ATP cone domain-containing protein [Patescibacteria group bacterium]|nr:ATP cone domain-containing protein [Patescibacteria group bacterium]